MNKNGEQRIEQRTSKQAPELDVRPGATLTGIERENFPRTQSRTGSKDYVRQISVLMPRGLLQLLDQEYFVKGWSKAALIRESIEYLFDAIETGQLQLDDQHIYWQLAALKGDMAMMNTYLFIRHIDLLDEYAHTYSYTRSDLVRLAVARYAKWIAVEQGTRADTSMLEVREMLKPKEEE